MVGFQLEDLVDSEKAQKDDGVYQGHHRPLTTTGPHSLPALRGRVLLQAKREVEFQVLKVQSPDVVNF